MTQMLLFDAPARAVTPFVSHESPSPVAGRTACDPKAAGRGGAPATPPVPPAERSGSGEIHRMGDLARLVIARYDLVAARRAARRTACRRAR